VFSGIVSDCLRVVFSFVVVDLYPTVLADPADLSFCSKYLSCFKFSPNCNVRAILKCILRERVGERFVQTKRSSLHTVQKESCCSRDTHYCWHALHYIDISYNTFMDNSTFSLLRGVKQLNMAYLSCRGGKFLLRDVDFQNLRQLTSLDMSGNHDCLTRITPRAFENLRNLLTLSIRGCRNDAIGDEIFPNLRQLRHLDMSSCNQCSITNRAFENLRNLSSLVMWACDQHSLSPRLFDNLRSLDSLDMSAMSPKSLTPQIFENLRNLHTLNMSDLCGPENLLSEESLRNLRRVKNLTISECQFECVSSLSQEAFANLRGVKNLNLDGWPWEFAFSGRVLQQFRGIKSLSIDHCNFDHVKDEDFRNLRAIKYLSMNDLRIRDGNDDAFRELAGIEYLSIHNWNCLSNKAFRFLKTLRHLEVCGCETISEEFADHLGETIQEVVICDCEQLDLELLQEKLDAKNKECVLVHS